MRAKVEAIFIGRVENSFEKKNDNGKTETIEYKQISVNVPGEMENCIIKVPVEKEIVNLTPYQPCYLLVDFRYDSKYKNYTARVVDFIADRLELEALDPYYDNPQANAYLASSVGRGKSADKA